MNRHDHRRPGTARADLPAAVVVGLDCITGLQTARILHDRGVDVIGVVADLRHWGAATNACRAVVESRLHGTELVTTLLNLALPAGAPRPVLVPCTDASVHTLSRARAQLEHRYRLALADHAVVERLMDKVRFAEHAGAHGFPVPRTLVLTDRRDAETAAATITFPCVLKPPYKSPAWLDRTTAKGFRADSAQELLGVFDRVADWSPVLLAQEWVVGPESGLISCNAYFGEGGELLAGFVARKIRQWPPDLGTSASGEELRDDEGLATTARLFGGVGFRGLAYLEMKRDARTGRLMIIEPNVGRPTGRSAIAEAGGVELVYTAFCDAAGLPLPSSRTQQHTGAKWVDIRRDAQAAVVARRRGELTLLQWLRWLRGPKAHAIWSRTDPLPFLIDVRQAMATVVRARGGPASRRPAGRQRPAFLRTTGRSWTTGDVPKGVQP